MKARTGALNREGWALVETAFRQLAAASFITVPVEQRHFTAASDLARRVNGLRAGDALHLAIASDYGATVGTLDKGMAKAAAELGVAVELI